MASTKQAMHKALPRPSPQEWQASIIALLLADLDPGSWLRVRLTATCGPLPPVPMQAAGAENFFPQCAPSIRRKRAAYLSERVRHRHTPLHGPWRACAQSTRHWAERKIAP